MRSFSGLSQTIHNVGWTRGSRHEPDGGQTALSFTVENGDTEVVLRRDDIQASAKDGGRRTPLSWTAEKGL
jgi:hypothetical protein